MFRIVQFNFSDSDILSFQRFQSSWGTRYIPEHTAFYAIVCSNRGSFLYSLILKYFILGISWLWGTRMCLSPAFDIFGKLFSECLYLVIEKHVLRCFAAWDQPVRAGPSLNIKERALLPPCLPMFKIYTRCIYCSHFLYSSRLCIDP